MKHLFMLPVGGGESIFIESVIMGNISAYVPDKDGKMSLINVPQNQLQTPREILEQVTETLNSK